MQGRILRAAAIGGLVGLIYFGLSGVLWTIRGHTASEVPEGAWLSLFVVYVLGATVAGAVVGFMQPGITSLYRAIGVFVFASVPLAIGFNNLFYPSESMQYKEPTPRVIGLTLFFGFIGGIAYWRRRGELY